MFVKIQLHDTLDKLTLKQALDLIKISEEKAKGELDSYTATRRFIVAISNYRVSYDDVRKIKDIEPYMRAINNACANINNQLSIAPMPPKSIVFRGEKFKIPRSLDLNSLGAFFLASNKAKELDTKATEIYPYIIALYVVDELQQGDYTEEDIQAAVLEVLELPAKDALILAVFFYLAFMHKLKGGVKRLKFSQARKLLRQGLTISRDLVH